MQPTRPYRVIPLLAGVWGIALPILTLAGCSLAMPPTALPGLSHPPASSPVSYAQGVQGRVLVLRGNQMPGPGPSSGGGAAQPVRTRVWVFRAPVMGSGAPEWSVAEAQGHSQWMGWVESDDQGHFRVGLPVGEYVLLAQYDDQLYLNRFQGDGHYMPVSVTPGEVTSLDLVNTAAAVF